MWSRPNIISLRQYLNKAYTAVTSVFRAEVREMSSAECRRINPYYQIYKEYLPEVDGLVSQETRPNDAWKKIECEEHYMGLFEQLSAMASPFDVFESVKSIQTSPMLTHRFYLDNDGIVRLDPRRYETVRYAADEARSIAGAFLQMAFQTVTNDLSPYKNAVGYLLLKPFCRLFPFPGMLRIQAIYRDFMIHERKTPVSFASKDDAVVALQRIFRKKIYRRNKPLKLTCSTESLLYRMSDSFNRNIICSPPVPTAYSGPSREAKERWIKNATRMPEHISKKIMDLVVYRTHKQFLAKLGQTVEAFNEYLFSLPAGSREYVIVLPQCGESSASSNHWVTGLAIQFLRKKPLAVLFDNHLYGFIQSNPKVKQCVYIDDAVYSGRQMSSLICSTPKGVKSIVIVPYYSKTYKIAHAKLILGDYMLSPNDMICTREIDHALCLDGSWDSPIYKVGTFFQHKVADSASTFLSDINSAVKPTVELIEEERYFYKPYRNCQ